jgi:hypothetical protein
MASPLASTLRAALPAAALALVACNGPTPTEIGEAACSNGVDDDRDMLVDCADPACRLFPWCTGSSDAGPPDAASVDATTFDAPGLDAAGLDAGPSVCAAPLDVVLVLDVSSSMGPDLAQVRDALGPIWDAAARVSTAPSFGLVVFVDDALAVEGCAPFASRDALAAELEAWRAFSSMNVSPVSRIPNVDCPENSLDALATAVTECPWRAGSRRVILHVTDDTFAERPAVLSGPFGPGVLVASTYVEVSDALARDRIRVGALARTGAGEGCGGPVASPDVGRGFHTMFGLDPSLPERTGGAAWDLRAARAGELDVGAAVSALLESVPCTP